jgi:hypothetical protein
MNGQWIGNYSGERPALGIIDLDDMGTYFDGHMRIVYRDLPAVRARIATPDRGPTQKLSLRLEVFNPGTGNPILPETLGQEFPGLRFPSSAAVELDLGPGMSKSTRRRNSVTGERLSFRKPNQEIGRNTDRIDQTGVGTSLRSSAHP